MKIYPFKGSYPKQDLIQSSGSFFSSIKLQYREYRENNIYDDLKEESFFIYQIERGGQVYTGFLTLTDTKALREGTIRRHEKTLAAKEQQMMHLLLQRKSLVKPVLLAYKPNTKIESLISKQLKEAPLVDFLIQADGEHHRVWQVSKPSVVAEFKKLFSKVSRAYIGGGHHRAATVNLLNKSKQLGKEAKKYAYMYTAYFPFNQLRIADYNRMVDISEIMPLSEFLLALSKYFDFKPLAIPAKPAKKHQLTMYIDGKWYLVNWRAKYIKSEKGKVVLDAALINRHIFKDILGIQDVRQDTRIKYFGGTQKLSKIESSANKSGEGIGICIYPVKMKELTAIADKGKTLPPKSTWFMPRLKSGLITKDL